jgi:lysyl-tRNA synthetase class 1
MFWVDEIVDDILQKYPDKKEFILRDEKTLSGRVHVGSLRGVVIHGIVAQALNERGHKARFVFEFNDVDPMDSLPGYLDPEVYNQYMGMPLRDIPAPDGKAKNFAEYWGEEFLKVINGIGIYPEIVRAGELYDSGVYNEWIEKILSHPDEIRAIYKEVSGSEKADDWFPLQVVCEKCGKVGSTKVKGWNGKEVSYVCLPDMVEWAKGCGHEGEVSPFDGKGKLPWKVEWPVKWAGNKVDIEGAGKDHCAAGGSHDVGERISEEILESPTPYNIPYEFFLIGGAKMSSSKGGANSAMEVFESVPPELLRFLMTRTQPSQPIEFNLDGPTIPRLYDQYDETAEHYFGSEKTFPDLDRLFHFSQIDAEHVEEHYRPRFSRVNFLIQMPHLEYLDEIKKLKGSDLNELDTDEAEARQNFAQMWLENFATDDFVFEIQKEIPESAHDLSAEQKSFLATLAESISDESLQDEDLHSKIHEVRKASTLEARDAFGAQYQSILGKNSGPQVGWFFSALDRKFLVERFNAVSELPEPAKTTYESVSSDVLNIDAEVVETFPGIKSAWTLIEGLKIGKNSDEITTLIDELVKSSDFESLKANSEKLQAYKKLLKAFGVDPTKRKPSPVALVDRLAKGKDFPRINNLVDLYNMLVVKHQFSLGAFDADHLSTPLLLRFSEHSDMFQGIGTDKMKKLEKDELCYFDAENLCIARDFNYYDSDVTKVQESTTRILLNVDATSAHDAEQMKLVMEEAIELITKHCGGTASEPVYVLAEDGVTLP